MRNRIHLTNLAILCAVVAALAAAQETASVEGVVLNKVTGAGIPGVTVWLWSSDTSSYKAVTNETGIFHIFGLTPGDYSSRVEKPGYSGTDPEMLVLLADPPKRHISAGPEPARLRFELNPPAVLRGRVTGTDGNPARATVEIAGGNTEKTNAEGLFAFENIQPGSYTLLARPTIAEHASAQDAIRIEPVPTYYPSVLDESLAETIQVRAGAELNGYEIRLQSAEVHRVRGIVLDPDGKPSVKATVQLDAWTRPADDTGIAFNVIMGGGANLSIHTGPGIGRSQEPPVVTAGDGVFEFPSVRSGEWMIQAHSDWVRDEIQHRNVLRLGSATLHVDHRDPDDLKIQFATPFSLSLPVAVVRSDGSPPGPGVTVVVRLTSETGPTGRVARIEPGGVLQIDQVIPGRYQFQADVVGGNYYVDSFWLGSTNITGQAVELAPVPMPVRIILKPAGTVVGTLEDADAGAIVLFPQNFAGTGYAVQTSVGRTFEITGVRPDEYYALALDRLDPADIADAVRLRGLVARATSVRVEPGSSSSVRLKVIHVAN